MKAPEKIYTDENGNNSLPKRHCDSDIEYIRKDVVIEKVINFLNYKLDDIVAVRVPGTIIPHHVAKQELIEDIKKYFKGE